MLHAASVLTTHRAAKGDRVLDPHGNHRPVVCLRLTAGSSQLQPPEDLEELVGQKLMVKFLEVDEEQERVVFSARRAHSEAFTSGFKVRHRSPAARQPGHAPALHLHTECACVAGSVTPCSDM